MTLLIVLLLLATPFPVHAARVAAQDTTAARLVGTVRHTVSGAPLAGVVVELIGTRYTGFTNDDGGFLIPDIRPGRYQATLRVADAEAAGVRGDTVTVLLSARVVSHIQLNARPLPAKPQEIVLRAAAGEAAGDETRGSIVGRVIDRMSGDPIASADVTLSGSVRALSNVDGRFAFPLVRAGRVHLAVEHLGYASASDSIDIIAGRVNDVYVRLGRTPLRLDAIRVEVRSDWLDRNGFYARRDDPGNFGYFIGREEIETRAVDNLPDLLARAPGVSVEHAGIGRRNVIIRRSYGSGGACVPDLYVDGMRLRGAFNDVSPLTIEAIEVYVGPDAPIQYLTTACGVVLVWTKRGD